MHELRLIDRLTNYWNLLRKDATVPDFAQFNISAIDDIWGQCVLFTVQHHGAGKPATLNFYAIGDKVKEIYSPDMVGRAMQPGQQHFQGANIVRKIGDLLAAPAMVYDQGQFVNERSKIVKYRSCLMPFGTRDGRITHVVTGLSWREF